MKKKYFWILLGWGWGDVGFSLLWPHGLFSSIIGQCWANRALEKLASVKHRQKHVTSRQQQTQSSQWQSDTLCQCPGYLQHVRTKHTALTLFTFVYLLFDFVKKKEKCFVFVLVTACRYLEKWYLFCLSAVQFLPPLLHFIISSTYQKLLDCTKYTL